MTANRAEQKEGGSMSLAARLRQIADDSAARMVPDWDAAREGLGELRDEIRALATEIDGYVMVPVEVGAPVIRLVEALQQFAYGDWLRQHAHRSVMCDSTDKLAFVEAAFTYGDILALAAALKR